MRSTVYVRNFESTLRLLADRGHQVHVVADAHRELDPTDLIGRLCREYSGITHEEAPALQSQRWPPLGMALRGALDYLRYLRPEYRDAPKLRRRAELKAPAFVMTALRRPFVNTTLGRALLGRIVQAGDRAVPRDPAIDAFVSQHRPDLVLVTPLVEPGSPQSEYLRSARALGSATGLCVYSWDNLTNKGLIHEPLDVVTVWNQPMKDEAIALHHVPADRVIVTGAAPYDHWFTWTPRATRDAFCARVGLDAQRPYLLYLCSSKFIAPNELPFVRKWVARIRAASPTLREAGVLVRPHPQNSRAWQRAKLGDLGQVVVWPRTAGNPVDAETRADYFDSIYHSAAVVGVNTSAQIESAIVGRGVYTLLAPEFRETQQGTLHFRHLQHVNGGLLHVAATVPEHVAQLEAAIRHPEEAAARCRRFVEAFVRPYGIDQPAAPRLVAALEAASARGAVVDRGPWWAVLVRPWLGRVAARMDDGHREAEPGPQPADAPAARALSERSESKGAPLSKEERARRRAEKQATAKTQGAQTTDAAFAHYLQVREYVRAMQAGDRAPDDLMDGEQRMLTSLDELWDADRETIADLRHQAKAITGVRRSDYSGPKSESIRVRVERDLLAVVERGDPSLWIEEPAALGGFGFYPRVNGHSKRFNEDTLRFYRVLSLLQDAAVLHDFQRSAIRRVVWEIGGWGGFAYQFKTVCPNVTYLITGSPNLLLLSGVYLTTLFPGASVRFYDPNRPDAFWCEWNTVDFAFAPESVVATMRPATVDLTLDLMSLEMMRPARVEHHVRRAYEIGSRYFFSVCPAEDPVPATASPVQPIIDRFYWRHPVSAPFYLGKRLALRAVKPGGSRGAIDRTYLLGWRRLHTRHAPAEAGARHA
jgi:hypothetical protein